MKIGTIKKEAKKIIKNNTSKNIKIILMATGIVFVLNLLRIFYYGAGSFEILSIDLTNTNTWYIDGIIDLIKSALLSFCYFVLIYINIKKSKPVDFKRAILNLLILSVPNAVRMRLNIITNSGNLGYHAQKFSSVINLLFLVVLLFLYFMINVQFTENAGIIGVVKKSSSITFKNIFKVVLFELSFILWILIPGLIFAVWKVLLIDYTGTEVFNLLYPVLSFVYMGAGFYFIPYYAVAKQLFYESLNK